VLGVVLCWIPSIRIPAAFGWVIAGLAASRSRAILFAALLPVAIRLALLPWFPPPEPFIHDEFGHLLVAETLASGRLANPVPAGWEHFESFHIFFQPVYSAVYFPGNSIFIAAALALTGHPWPGVLLSMAVLCGVAVWTLEGWMPRRWALLGAIALALRFGIWSYWTNSYWGGAVAATGGFLLIGSAGPKRKFSPVAFGVGSAILLFTRPFEGLIAGAAISAAGAIWRRRLGPALAIVAVAVLALGYYNYRVTGDPWKPPYKVTMELYADGNVIPGLSPRKTVEYRHDVMRRYNEEFETHNGLAFQSATAFFELTRMKADVWRNRLLGPALLLPLVVGAWLRRRWGLALAAALSAFSIHQFIVAHYFSPLLGLQWVLALIGLRWLTLVQFTRNLGIVLALAVVVSCLSTHKSTFVDHVWGCCPMQGNLARAATVRELEAMGGRHLVLITYNPNHYVHHEWVFNAASIADARIIWARSMTPEKDAALMAAYPDRTVWRMNPDLNPRAREKIR